MSSFLVLLSFNSWSPSGFFLTFTNWPLSIRLPRASRLVKTRSAFGLWSCCHSHTSYSLSTPRSTSLYIALEAQGSEESFSFWSIQLSTSSDFRKDSSSFSHQHQWSISQNSKNDRFYDWRQTLLFDAWCTFYRAKKIDIKKLKLRAKKIQFAHNTSW